MMGSGAIEKAVLRAMERLLGKSDAAKAMDAFFESAGTIWPEDSELALDLARNELFDVVASMADRATAEMLLVALEDELTAAPPRRKRATPRAPMPNVRTTPADPEEPPPSGATRKPGLQAVVITREFTEVSQLGRVLPHGRAVLVTKSDRLASQLDRPGWASILVFDARNPPFGVDVLIAYLDARNAPLLVVVWGAEHVRSGELDELARVCAGVAAVSATSSAIAIARVCLDLIGGRMLGERALLGGR